MTTLSTTRIGNGVRCARAGIAALALACAPVFGAVEHGSQNGVRYENGGWSFETAQELQQQSGQYPLMLVFAAKQSGEYLADVKVKVRDARGAAVVAMDEAGPIVLIGLAPGNYRIEATRNGQTHSRTLHVGERTHEKAVFYWNREHEDS